MKTTIAHLIRTSSHPPQSIDIPIRHTDGGAKKQFNLIITIAGICQPDIINYYDLKNIPVIDLFPIILSRFNMIYDNLPNEFVDYNKLTAQIIDELFTVVDQTIDDNSVFIYDILKPNIDLIQFFKYIFTKYDANVYFINSSIEAGIRYLINIPTKYGKYNIKDYLYIIPIYYYKSTKPLPTDISVNRESIISELSNIKKAFWTDEGYDTVLDNMFSRLKVSSGDTITFVINPDKFKYINIAIGDLDNIYSKLDLLDI